MATTVSERPQTRRSSTGWSNRWLLGSLAVVATLFAASASKFVWATFVVAFIFLFGLSRWLKPAALPKQEETAPLTMPLHKSSIRPFERPNDWVDRMGRLTGSFYRTGRHGATGTYHMGRDTVAPAIGRGVVRFGAMLRERLVPKLVNTASWVFSQLARVSTRTWLIIGGGFGLFVGAGLVTLMLRGDISDTPAIPTAIAMLAGSVGLMMLISRIGAPYYPDESLPEEGGLVMDESNDSAQDHGEEVPTSPSVPADDGVERTSKNLGTREERHARLSEMFAQQQRVTEPTVQMTPSEHAEVWEGSRFASVMTGERPAPAPEVEWPSAPAAAAFDMDWPLADYDGVSTASSFMEDDEEAAQSATGASEPDDTGDLPVQEASDEDDNEKDVANRILKGEIKSDSTREYWIVMVPPITLFFATMGLWAVFAWATQPSVRMIVVLIYAALAVTVSLLFWGRMRARYLASAAFISENKLRLLGWFVGMPVVLGLLVWLLLTLTGWSLAFMLPVLSFVWDIIVSTFTFFTSSLANATLPIVMGTGLHSLVEWYKWRTNKVYATDRHLMKVTGFITKKKGLMWREKITDISPDDYFGPFQIGPSKWGKELKLPVIKYDVETAGQNQAFDGLEFIPRRFAKYI